MNEREVAAGMAATPGYRYADAVDDELFVAGQVPNDATGELVAIDDPAGQATRCLDNLRTVAEANGFGRNDIRHLRIYVVGEHQHLLDAWGAVTEWWEGEVPPATLLGVEDLGYDGQLVEIDARVVRRRPDDR